MYRMAIVKQTLYERSSFAFLKFDLVLLKVLKLLKIERASNIVVIKRRSRGKMINFCIWK